MEEVSVLTFLRKHAKIGDIVIFREYGWQIGMTRVDNEYVFLRSLSSSLLSATVRHHEYAERDWANRKVLVLDIW